MMVVSITALRGRVLTSGARFPVCTADGSSSSFNNHKEEHR